MTAGGDELFVQIGGRDVGLEAVLKKVDAEMAVSADRAVKLGQQYARLAQAQGQPTAAAGILAGTMDRAGAASERSLIGLATQQANLTNSSKNLTSTIAGLGGQLSGLGGTAGSLAGSIGSLAGSLGTLGTVGAAIGIAKVGIDLAETGAQAELVRQRFDGLATAAHTTGDALIGALRAASGGEISDLNLELTANRAQLLGVAHDAQTFSALMAVARDRAQQLGTSTQSAFDDIVTGIGRASPRILDNLGIIISEKGAYDTYAASIGKAADQLSDAEKKTAILNAVLEQGQSSIRATGGAAETTASQIAQGQAAFDNLKTSVGGLAAVQLGPLAADIGKVANALAGAGDFSGLLSGVGDLTAKFNPVLSFWNGTISAIDGASVAMARFVGLKPPDNIAPIRDSLNSWLQILGLAPAASDATTAATQQMAGAFDTDRQAIAQAQGAMQAQAAAIAQTGGAYGAYVQAANAAGIANQAAATKIQFSAQAMQQSAEASVLDAAQKQAQKAATDQLTASTTEAVNAFLALYPTIDAAGIASAVMADKIPALIGRLAQLRVEAYSARDAVAALAAQQGLNTKNLVGPAGIGVNAPGITSGRNNDVDAVVALQKANKDAADARSAQIIAIGSNQQKVNEYEHQYADAVKASGKDSAAAIQAETRLKQARIEAAKPQKGGGGGTRLSDQQKLQNSLLTSQEDYQQKSEDAAAQYATDTAKIYQDFYAKMQAAQKDFDQSQLEGRAGFYDSLGSIENQKIAQQASAAYEQASVEAGKIAQEKGADVAEKYMSAQEQIISARAKRLAEIEKAEKEKDAGKAEYLRGVDEQYRKAEDAKLARIQEGEGSIASERDKQLADAAQKEQDAQDKIGLAADRAADKKILASDRAGKKIDEEIAKAGVLAATYDRVGQAGSRAGITPAAAASTPPAASPVPTSAAAPVAATATPDALLSAMDAIRASVDAASAAIVRATNDTTGAVRGLKNSGNIAA